MYVWHLSLVTMTPIVIEKWNYCQSKTPDSTVKHAQATRIIWQHVFYENCYYSPQYSAIWTIPLRTSNHLSKLPILALWWRNNQIYWSICYGGIWPTDCRNTWKYCVSSVLKDELQEHLQAVNDYCFLINIRQSGRKNLKKFIWSLDSTRVRVPIAEEYSRLAIIFKDFATALQEYQAAVAVVDAEAGDDGDDERESGRQKDRRERDAADPVDDAIPKPRNVWKR